VPVKHGPVSDHSEYSHKLRYMCIMFICTNNYVLRNKQQRSAYTLFYLLVNFPAVSVHMASGQGHSTPLWAVIQYCISVRTDGGTMVSSGKKKNLPLLPQHVIHQ